MKTFLKKIRGSSDTKKAKDEARTIFAQLAAGRRFTPDDVFIAVMGMTGSGKSTFISHCTNGAARVGHGLVSCTSEVELYTFQHNGVNVHLIDTPGFDDTYRTDLEVLKDIAFWLFAAYENRVKLSGVIYLHPIDKNRMTGSALKNLRMFQCLCGTSNLPSVFLATTMWSNVVEADGARRETELRTKPEFWGRLLDGGSRTCRLANDQASAMTVVSTLIEQRASIVLQIQREMLDERKPLNKTSAGLELGQHLNKQQEIFETRLKDAKEKWDKALADGDRKAAEEASKEKERLQGEIDKVTQARDDLKVEMDEMRREKEEQFAKAIKDLDDERTASSNRSIEVTQEIRELRRQLDEKQRESKSAEERYQSEKHLRENLERAPPSYTPRPSAPGFEESFKSAAGTSLGNSALPTAILGTAMAVAVCVVM